MSASLLHKIKDKISELDHWTDKQETKAAICIILFVIHFGQSYLSVMMK